MIDRLTPRRLMTLLGVDAAIELMARHGGQCVPRITPALLSRLERDKAIRRDVDGSESYAEVGDRYGLSRGRIAQLANSD